MKLMVMTLLLAALVLVALPLAGSAIVSGVLSEVGGLPAMSPVSPSASPDGVLSAVPARILGVYIRAAAACPGLPWTLLAAIGTVESANGTSDLPGVRSGTNAAGAEGPMQFEPGTFAAYGLPVPAGGVSPPSPYDPVDAIYAAERMLCVNGAGRADGVERAVYDYNHSDAYVSRVLSIASAYSAAIAEGGSTYVGSTRFGALSWAGSG